MTIDDAAFEVSVPYYVENAQALLRYFKGQRSVIKKNYHLHKKIYMGKQITFLIKLKKYF